MLWDVEDLDGEFPMHTCKDLVGQIPALQEADQGAELNLEYTYKYFLSFGHVFQVTPPILETLLVCLLKHITFEMIGSRNNPLV